MKRKTDPREADAAAEAAAAAAEIDDPEQKQAIREHLMALRKVLIVCFAAIAVGFVAAFYFIIDPLLKWITALFEERGVHVIYTAVSESRASCWPSQSSSGRCGRSSSPRCIPRSGVLFACSFSSR